jgi:Flp pilus assembly protein TadG
MATFLCKFLGFAKKFRRDSRGAMAMLYALCFIPVLLIAGMAVDFAQIVRIRAQLNAAADEATLAAVSTSSPGYTAATKMSSDGPVPAAAK